MEYKNGKTFIFITSLLCIPTPILAKTINNNEVLSNCFIQLIMPVTINAYFTPLTHSVRFPLLSVIF